MADWIQVDLNDLSDKEPPRKDQNHSFTSPKGLAWLHYCRHCGHVGLKNVISVLVTKIGCGYERDPRYQTWAKSTSRGAR